MSIQRFTPDNYETFTLELHPRRAYSSGSSISPVVNGITGALPVFPNASRAMKDTEMSFLASSSFNDSSFQSLMEGMKLAPSVAPVATNISSYVAGYMSASHALPSTNRQSAAVNVNRFEVGVKFDEPYVRKSVIRSLLFPYYRTNYNALNWGFTNYNTLNFFTASTVPSDSAIMYVNSQSYDDRLATNIDSYSVTSSFTFDFYINPRYTTDRPNNSFHAGTLLHLSSSYALSLITGSLRDENDYPAGYRLLLQLSQSADTRPSLAGTGSSAFPNNFVFASDDNSLRRNTWHHVSIRWGTNMTNDGSGSFIVDGVQRGSFNIPSASVSYPVAVGFPDVLTVGNFYEGTDSGANAQGLFFAEDPATRNGLITLVAGAGTEAPAAYSLNHPLNAEVHDLKIYRKHLSMEEIGHLSASGPSDMRDLAFYVPPFFVKESPYRKFVGTFGGVMQTPFFAIDSHTDDPFNVSLAFGVNGHDINLENYVRDFATGNYPLLFNLTPREIGVTTEYQTANEFLFATASNRKRNVTVLPCDNGRFKPNFSLLVSGAYTTVQGTVSPSSGTAMDHFVNDLGCLDLGLVSLNNMMPTSSLRPGLIDGEGDILSDVWGSTPENLGVDPGEVLTVFQRQRDNSSSEVTFFDVSNMYYGMRIQPGTLMIRDMAITGTAGKVGVTLRDDANGNLYRADCVGSHPVWSSVGNVLYNEGIIAVLSPVMPFFGKEQYEVEFRGEQHVHVMKLHSFAPAGQVNSSSNPNFLPLSASLNANDNDREFVYISGLAFHDDNLNVIMRTNFAQPIVKRRGSRIKFVTRIDM